MSLVANIKAIIFDCDGTLVDSEPAHFSSWQYALQKQGGDLSVEEYYSYLGGNPEIISKALAEKLGTDCAEEILKDKRTSYQALQAAGLSPIEPTIDFLRYLAKEKHRLGLKLGLASATKKASILIHLRHHHIEELFDVILSGQDDLVDYTDPEGVNKPKPYIYLHAAKLLGVPPHECVVIEDSHFGVTAAVRAGCLTVAVPNRYTQHQDLSHAHLKIESFSERSPEAFLEIFRASMRLR